MGNGGVLKPLASRFARRAPLVNAPYMPPNTCKTLKPHDETLEKTKKKPDGECLTIRLKTVF